MGTLTLTVGTVTGAGGVVGDPPQWSDNLDSTYAITDGSDYARAPISGAVTGMNALTMTMRLAITGVFSPTDPAARTVALHYFDGEDDLGATKFVVSALGGIEDVTVDLVPSDLDDPNTIASLGTAIAAGGVTIRALPIAFFVGSTFHAPNTATIYELDLVATLPARGAPLRRYPRAGATGPTRQWPRRITRRPGTY